MPPPRAAERERRSNDERKSSDFFCNARRIGERTRHAGARNIEADPQHRFLEQLAIFALRDGFRVGADQFHFVPRQRAVAIQFHGGVQRGLAAHRGQNGVRLFSSNDGFDHFRGDRLDVGAIGELRIGHDRGRIRVHQHDLVAFLAQRLARLHAGIIKFAALPDHDWTGADQQNFLKIVVPRHLRSAQDKRNRPNFTSSLSFPSESRRTAANQP